MAEGMDVSALERVTGIKEGTLRTWLTWAGVHAEKLHRQVFQELIFQHIQLDELWANVDYKTQEVWLWVATEATSKLIPVIQVGPRSLDMAMGAVHALGCTMQTGSLPIITTDGLNLTLRQGVALLGRRTWGTAQYMPELEGHLQWWRDYYHYSRYHESLRITQGPPSSARANSFPTLSQPNPSPGGWPDQPPLVSAATD